MDRAEPAVDEEALAARLEAYPLALAVLFGSRASGRATALSDVDVAVRFEERVTNEEAHRLLDRIAAEVANATGIDAVDVVDLDTAPPTIGYAALADGRLLLGDPDAAAALEATFLQRKLDFRPVKREWDDALAERIAEGRFGRP